jgi:histidine triad (HIT) family protein
MADDCLFCRMILGEVPTPVVYESETAFAFLDHRPLFLGHCLVLPRRHVPTLPDLPTDLVGLFFQEVQLLTSAVETAMSAQGTFVAMNNRISQSVPHLHVHVVPRNRGDGLKGFFWPRTRYESEEQREKVRAAIAKTAARMLAEASEGRAVWRFHRGRFAAAYPGSVLGLAIIQATMEVHGGRVRAEGMGQTARQGC